MIRLILSIILLETNNVEIVNKEYEENSKFSSIQYRGNEREINMFNFERDYPQKICRTFCKCGNVETSSVKSCPVCGNDKIARYSYLNGYKETEYGNIVKIEKTANKVNIKLTKYDVVINSTNEIEIVEEPERLIATIRNDSADIRYSNECSKLGSSIFEEIPFTYDGFELFGEKKSSVYMESGDWYSCWICGSVVFGITC